ncbi:pyridoxal-phosphate dependent enzyme [Streptomyces californicus]|uniref:pyridoxal-phosphate dependent enzyme n=1 Tax=Streptomyces californicus TaxID=67351 RepID=UPI0036F72E60
MEAAPPAPGAPGLVSLGQGGAPTVALRHLPGVRINDERANPTGSFKDRKTSPAVSWARDRGFGTVAVAPTGHAAVSTAAYAAAAWAVRHGRGDGYAPS